MRGPEAGKVRSCVGEDIRRVSRNVTGHGSMEPDRLPLIAAQPRDRRDPTRKGFDLTPPKASLFRASSTGQEPLVAQVHDMLPRRPQDGRGVARSDEFALAHVGIMSRKHKKHNQPPRSPATTCLSPGVCLSRGFSRCGDRTRRRAGPPEYPVRGDNATYLERLRVLAR